MDTVIELPTGENGGRRKIRFTEPNLPALFNGEGGCIVVVSMERLAHRITQDRGSMSSLISELDKLNNIFDQINTGHAIKMPLLNSRRRDVHKQLLVDEGRHELYALRSLGVSKLPVIVPLGLSLQFEMELGLKDFEPDFDVALASVKSFSAPGSEPRVA